MDWKYPLTLIWRTCILWVYSFYVTVTYRLRSCCSLSGNGTLNLMAPTEIYRTRFGRVILTKAEDYLPTLPPSSVDLVITSPPFALLRQKAYGNLDQAEYVDWLVSFGPLVKRVLKDTGSFVIDLGGAYRAAYRADRCITIECCCGYVTSTDFFWPKNSFGTTQPSCLRLLNG